MLGDLRQLAECSAISPYDGVTASRYGTVMKDFRETHCPPTQKEGNGDPDFARLVPPWGGIAQVFLNVINLVQSLPRLVPSKVLRRYKPFL